MGRSCKHSLKAINLRFLSSLPNRHYLHEVNAKFQVNGYHGREAFCFVLSCNHFIKQLKTAVKINEAVPVKRQFHNTQQHHLLYYCAMFLC